MNQAFHRALARILLSLSAIAVAPFAIAQGFPEKPLRVSVGFPAGTGPDLLARVVGQRLAQDVKQAVVIENKPGAGGRIATRFVVGERPDGYNLLLAEAGSVSIAPAAYAKLAYDPDQDLVGVAELAWADFVLIVPAASPYQTLAQMAADNQRKEKPLYFATFGAGSPGHLGAVAFGMQAQVKVEPIHYRSTGDAVTGIIASDADGAWVSTAVASAQLKGGKVRALAITAKARSPLIPTVPTTAEAGMPGLDFSSWLGVLAPAGTPDAVLDILNQQLRVALRDPDVRQKLIEAGFSVTGTDRVATERMLRAEAERWHGIVKASGFQGD